MNNNPKIVNELSRLRETPRIPRSGVVNFGARGVLRPVAYGVSLLAGVSYLFLEQRGEPGHDWYGGRPNAATDIRRMAYRAYDVWLGLSPREDYGKWSQDVWGQPR